MASRNDLCPHCGGTGTCQNVDELYSCPECLRFYGEQLERTADLHIVPCAYCRGTGKAAGVEGISICAHCEGGGYCRPYDVHVGCDFCMEKHIATHPQHNADYPLIQVACGVCDGKGYMKAPAHRVEAKAIKKPPAFSMFRVVVAFIITFIIAMIGSVIAVWAVQADTRSRMDRGDMDEAIRFDSYLTVHDDWTMTVEEIVILKSKQRRYFSVERVFPALKGSIFGRTKPDIFLEEVYLDGESLRFRSEVTERTVRIRAPHKVVAPGVHTYAFVYRMRAPLLHHHGEALLNWVVSGKRWGFPAKQVTMAVSLPPRVDKRSLRISGGVGPVFWFKRECISTIDDSGNITFSAGQPLTPLDQFGIRVAW